MGFAEIILQQLGGQRFIAMTGTSRFVSNKKEKTLSMKLKRNASKAQYLIITLTPADEYDMKFSKFNRDFEEKIMVEYKGIHADQLQKLFTEATGLYTSL